MSKGVQGGTHPVSGTGGQKGDVQHVLYSPNHQANR